METSVLRFLFRKHKRKKVSQMYTVCQHHLLQCVIAVFTLREMDGHNRFLDYIYLIVKKSSVWRQRNFLNFGTELLCCFIWWVICGPPSLSKRVISTDVDTVFFGEIGNACIQCTYMLVFIHWSIWCGIKPSYKSKIRCRIPCTQDVIIHSCRAHAIHTILIDETYVRKDILSRFKGKKRRSTNWILDSCNGNLYTTYRKGASTKKK